MPCALACFNAVKGHCGALIATYFRSKLMIFGAGLFVLGIICGLVRLQAAYRFAGVTLSIIVLVARDMPAWIVAEHRFIEVSLGIAVAMIMTIVWPEHHDERNHSGQ